VLLKISSLTGLCILLVIAAVNDWRFRTIENRVNAAIALLFPLAALAFNMPWEQFAWHITTGLVMFLVCAPAFFVGIIGGGDAKMIPAVSLWFGWTSLLPFLMLMAISGLVLALIVVLILALHSEECVERDSMCRQRVSTKISVPYAVAISVGAIATLPISWWWYQL
jgi:prepilin peptidase CpaA